MLRVRGRVAVGVAARARCHPRPSPPPPPPLQQHRGQFTWRVFSSSSSNVRDGDADSFEELVREGSYKRPVIVDFWAQWCGPCRVLGPVLEREVARHGPDALTLVKMDTDKNTAFAQRCGVRSLPTVFLVHEGELVETFVGMPGDVAVQEFVARAARLSSNNNAKAVPPSSSSTSEGKKDPSA